MIGAQVSEVSIIIPTYNRASSLKRTLISIINQTYTDYEVIIVSNGSTDNTKDIVDQFQDERLKYIFQKGSGSPASPRNTGIKSSKGDYIAFCDDDDLWLPEKLEKQIAFLKKNANYGICYTRMRRFNEELEWINPDDETIESTNSQRLLYRNTVPLSSIIIRKSVFKNGEYFDEDKKIFGSEDYELLLRLSKKTNFFCLSEYLLLYYSGCGRFSNSTSKNSFKINLLYLSRLYHVYRKVVAKDLFRWHEVFNPFCINFFVVLKIILYNFLRKIKTATK